MTRPASWRPLETLAPVFSFARLSTGIKMLVILSTALLPLGMIALFASVESARSNRLARESDTRSMAAESARRIDAVIAGSAQALRIGLAQGSGDAAACRMAELALPPAQQGNVRIAIFDRSGRGRCGRELAAPSPIRPPPPRGEADVHLLERERAVRIGVAGAGGTFGIAEIGIGALARAALPADASDPYAVALVQHGARMTLVEPARDRPLEQRLVATVPIAAGRAKLEMIVWAPPITALQMIMAVSPLLMWVAAAVIGWFVVERLLLSPLAQMQHAILGYRAGDGPLILPRVMTPALELRRLGEAFRMATDELAGHEAELEEGLARQRRLTREVHHRVKNNLQVVSSLINLHSRGATDPAVAAAYASIQRRVDALAIVHRNHYAELEENLGVGLRALVGELAANLRATAPPECARMAITLNMMPASVTQDVAVPVAFLITEVVELVTICASRSSVAIMLQPGASPDRALLTIDAPGLDDEACLGHPSIDRFRRIIQGLGRQLRSTLHHEEGSGRFVIEIAVVPQGKAESATEPA